jgi:hypothetical protein
MRCPKCPEVEMETVEVHEVKIDRCPSCGGAWYDRGELEALKDRESGGDFAWLDAGLWRDADRVEVDKRSQRRCPQDDVPLASVRYGGPEVTVEVCPVCFGIWLDRGEYDRIIDHLEDEVDSETLAGYMREMGDEVVDLFAGRHDLKTEFANLGKILYLMRLRLVAEHPTLVKIKEALRHLVPE